MELARGDESHVNDIRAQRAAQAIDLREVGARRCPLYEYDR